MSAVDQFVDALGVFLTGGPTNVDPNASLGGAPSAIKVRGWGCQVNPVIPAVRVDDVFPGSGTGVGSLAVDASGNVTYTPPGDTAGAPITVAPGAGAVLSGAGPSNAVRIFNEAGLALAGGPALLTLTEILNGAIAQKNVTDAQRSAGVTTYRALMLGGRGLLGATNVRLWLPADSTQATWSIALETPSGGSIQTIASETTAPVGLTWSSPTVEGGALVIPSLVPGQYMGLWLRRVFPAAGVVSVRESVKLAVKYLGGGI